MVATGRKSGGRSGAGRRRRRGWALGRVENINLSYSLYAFVFLDVLGGEYEIFFVF